MAELDTKIANLAANFTRRVVPSTLANLHSDREAKKDWLMDRIRQLQALPPTEGLPQSALLKRYGEMVKLVHLARPDPSVQTKAAQTLRSLIETATV